MEFDVFRIDPDLTYDLRERVLRPGAALVELQFEGDGDEPTAHYGAFVDEAIVAIASIYHEGRPGGGDDQGGCWRLRGMASDPEVRRRGAGSAVLEACIRHARGRDGSLAWCNARIPAVAFYEAHGWTVVGEEFEIPTIGPHVVMERTIA